MTAVHRPFFYIDPDESRSSTFRIRGADARHLSRVRRAAKGDLVWISDGRGSVWEAEVKTIAPVEVELEANEVRFYPPASPRITVLVGLAKGAALDDAIRGLVELGVEDIVIFSSSRSLPTTGAAALRRRQAIALAAAKQSHRPWLADVQGPVTLAKALAGAPRPLYFGEPAGGSPLRKVFSPESSNELSLLIGPEGGLSDAEISQITESAGIPFTLGDQILRTGTATIAITACFLYHFGRLG